MDKSVLGSRIRQARERKGLSQEALAQAVDKDQRAISEIESGRRKLAAVDLPDFAGALEVPLLYFFEDTDPTDELEIALLREFRRMPSSDMQKMAISILRVMHTSPQLPPELAPD